MKLPPFLSDDPMEGDPPSAWDDFLSPQLRRFPVPYEKIRVKKRIGHGTEGCVVRIQVDDHDERRFALKIFFMSAPEKIKSTWWPFERHACNAAILEKVAVGLRRSFPRPIHVPAKRITRLDCLRRLHAFSTDGLRCRAFDRLPANQKIAISDGFTHVRKCFGWIRVRGRDFIAMNERIEIDWNRSKDEGIASHLKADEEYFALAFEYIPNAKFECDALQRQLEFFHHIGFDACQPAKHRNWQGPGILLDFGDYNTPVDRWFGGRGAWFPCLTGKAFLEPEDWREDSEASRKWDRIQEFGMTEEEEREQKKQFAQEDTAMYVERAYKGLFPSYFDLTAKEIQKLGLEEDPLAQIQILGIEPKAVRKAWMTYKTQRRKYLRQVKKDKAALIEASTPHQHGV